MSMNSSRSTLVARLWPATTSRLPRALLLALAGSAVVALAAQVSVPMFPVPMTLQSLAVLLVGAAYGARLGALTLALYAVEGLVGLPVFAHWMSGPAYFFGPTGGYILGFVLAAGLVGYLAERGWTNGLVTSVAAMLLGAAVLYVPGLLWLANWMMGAKAMTWQAALPAAAMGGLVPFIIGDTVKSVIAGLAVPRLWNLLSRR
jgi:biotin transport system substrate-specific component